MFRPVQLLFPAVVAVVGCGRVTLDLTGNSQESARIEAGVETANPVAEQSEGGARPGHLAVPEPSEAGAPELVPSPDRGDEPQPQREHEAESGEFSAPEQEPFMPNPETGFEGDSKDAGPPQVIFCGEDHHCPKSHPECHPGFGICVECHHEWHCEDGQVCSATLQCIDGCAYNDDCELGLECDRLSAQCVECVTSQFCFYKDASRAVCVNSECAPCGAGRPCPGGLECVAGRCEGQPPSELAPPSEGEPPDRFPPPEPSSTPSPPVGPPPGGAEQPRDAGLDGSVGDASSQK